jgi:hypothetical protein
MHGDMAKRSGRNGSEPQNAILDMAAGIDNPAIFYMKSKRTKVMSEDRLAKIEADIRELKDIREIKDVFFNFHYACTGGFTGKQAGRMEALDCLTDDATIEVLGLHEPGKGPRGREQVKEYWDYYYGDAGPLPYVFQTSVNEKVELSGDTAVGYSNMLMIVAFREGKPLMGLSQRVNDYVRTDTGWKIKKTTMVGGFTTHLDGIEGALNKLPPAEERQPWTYRAA